MALFYQSEQVLLPLVAVNLALRQTSLFKVRNLFYKSVLNECSQFFHSSISLFPNHLEPRGWWSQEVSIQILHPRTRVPGCPKGRGSSRWEQHLAQSAETPPRFPSCGIRVKNSSQDLTWFFLLLFDKTRVKTNLYSKIFSWQQERIRVQQPCKKAPPYLITTPAEKKLN